ncbi:hypothetical protein [Janthinobacterium lividum]|uniref:hypothetical protein n=1 Tax=Janthinobacterium lividum TaxID=29581 RepID=UPI000B0CF746|nr:hypothetical protein [Janthinobacterium lividum]
MISDHCRRTEAWLAVKTGEAGRLDIKHLAEIQHMPAYADEFWKLYAGETLLAEWRTPEATA